MKVVAEQASATLGRQLPVNATGAIGAIASDLELPWQVCRGLAVMARAIGLVAHLQEELEEPLATEIWRRADEEASEHLRPGVEPSSTASPGSD
jgi:citrate synthase